MTRHLFLAAMLGVTSLSMQSTASSQATPPDDQAAVLAVVDTFINAISTNDFATMAKLRVEGSFNTTESVGAGGATRLTRRVFNPEGSRPGNYRERYWDPIVHVRGGLAVVWTPYEFWRDGTTSHCGIDVFTMSKEQGAWRIADMMWTIEPEACPALRPSDPSRIRPKG